MGWRPCEAWANKRLRRKEGSWENKFLTDPIAFSLFQHSIIPVWNLQNGWRGIPYYQQFLELPRHNINSHRI
jgi:hypothetical protein